MDELALALELGFSQAAPLAMEALAPNAQVRAMCAVLYPAGLNIDYYPTNFVPRGETLYYIDYECNAYMEQWDFEHWGAQYWTEPPSASN